MTYSIQRAGGCIFFAFTVLILTYAAHASDTVGCVAKTTWRNEIVDTLVKSWYRNDSRTDDLLDLIQAEQGIAACSLGRAQPKRLHTSTLPRDLRRTELGGLILANELHWAHLLPDPEDGLSGRAFPVLVPPLRAGGQ
jgi:hypothetical protein